MVATDQIDRLFADARQLHASALERLAAGDVRDGAEKAWASTKRATEGLVLARTGEVPPNSTRVAAALRGLARESLELRALADRYGATARYLHNDCFYNGNCDPVEDTERRIRETLTYVQSAEELAALGS